jgi:hypothetical protein
MNSVAILDAKFHGTAGLVQGLCGATPSPTARSTEHNWKDQRLLIMRCLDTDKKSAVSVRSPPKYPTMLLLANMTDVCSLLNVDDPQLSKNSWCHLSTAWIDYSPIGLIHCWISFSTLLKPVGKSRRKLERAASSEPIIMTFRPNSRSTSDIYDASPKHVPRNHTEMLYHVVSRTRRDTPYSVTASRRIDSPKYEGFAFDPGQVRGCTRARIRTFKTKATRWPPFNGIHR